MKHFKPYAQFVRENLTFSKFLLGHEIKKLAHQIAK